MENTVEVYKIHLEAFTKVATAVAAASTATSSSAGSSSGGSFTISSFSLKELTISPIYAFVNMPICRAATLQFFATLIREHVSTYLTCLENPNQPADYGNVEEALNEIDIALKQDLRERDGRWCLEIFEWSLETLAEISKKNANRRALARGNTSAGGGDGGLSDVLQTYTGCRSTRLLLELLNECVGRLLASSPEQCISSLLETTARFGNFCDWILTFIGTKYPKTIIDQLLAIGSADFSAYVTEMIGKQTTMSVKQIISKQDQYHREKLLSLSSILGHLARQQGVELRRQLSSVIQDGLIPNANQRQQYSLAFVVKAASLSRDVADMLLQDLHHLVTADKIATITRIFGQIPHMILFGEHNPAHVLINVIMALKESTLSLLYDKMLRLAFDPLTVERNDSRTNVYMIHTYALSVLEVLMTNMERHVHNNVTFPPESTPLLNEIEKNLPMALKRLFSRNEMQRNYYFKCLTLLCFVRGEAKTVEILASVLYRSVNEQQLSLFVCFCRVLHPVHSHSVERLFVNLPDHYEKHRGTVVALDTAADEYVEGENDWQWMENVRTLLCWDQASVAKKEINIMNLTEIFLNHYSQIVEYLLPLVGVNSFRGTVLDVLTKIGQPVHQSPQTVIRLVTQCCSLVFTTLEDLGTPDGLELNRLFVEYFVMFVHSQPPYAVEIALRTVLARVMQAGGSAGADGGNVCALFGLSPEQQQARVVTEKEEKTTTTTATNPRQTPDESATADGPLDFAATPLLIGNRTTTKNGKDENGFYTSLELVHSGVIRKGRIERTSTVWSEKDILCKLSFVRLIDRLCSTIRAPGETAAGPSLSPSKASASSCNAIGQTNAYSLDVCRLLASMLTEYFCPDAIAADHSWDDWDASKSSPERYLATSKRLEDIPFSWDLLNIVAEAYPCIWFCAPLIQSILATAILQCENAIDKSERVTPKLLRVMQNLFLVLYKGRLLTEPLSFVIDLLPHITLYEAACVLCAVWQYFQAVTPDMKTLEHHVECIQLGTSLDPIKADHRRFLDIILLVIQANIARAGHLLDKFIDVSAESVVEPMDE